MTRDKEIAIIVVNKYKDNASFIDSSTKDVENDRFFDDEQSGNTDKLHKFILELDDDEKMMLNTKKKLFKYNKNTGRYVTEYLGDRLLRYMNEKNESNNNIANDHKYGNKYRLWKCQTKKEIQNIGEMEDNRLTININRDIKDKNNDISINKHKSIKELGLKRFRHAKGGTTDWIKKSEKQKYLNLKKTLKSKKDIKKKKIEKIKKDKFRDWWAKNKTRVKKRKAMRRRRPY